jgi:predicted ATP-grasp superfamily ATP-dependent carboligase
LNERLHHEQYDVLLPVHDQVYLLARVREILSQRVGVALPEFESLAQVQSKAQFSELLDSLSLPQPSTKVVRTRGELDQVSCEFPCYAKLSYSTAGCGVWLVENRAELRRLSNELEGAWAETEFPEMVLQAETKGSSCVVAAVFQDGRLLAAHAYRTRQTGVGGSAQARESVSHPHVYEDVARLGAHLCWHGAMHVEYFHDDATDRPTYIETNPRIGETFNATLSGTNLCELLVNVSLGDAPTSQLPSRIDVKTHSLMTSLLAAGERGDSRHSLLAEMARVWRGRGIYQNSEDELTRPREDYLSLLPLMFVAGRLLVRPASANKMIRAAVSHYALTQEAVSRIRGLSSKALVECFC